MKLSLASCCSLTSRLARLLLSPLRSSCLACASQLDIMGRTRTVRKVEVIDQGSGNFCINFYLDGALYKMVSLLACLCNWRLSVYDYSISTLHLCPHVCPSGLAFFTHTHSYTPTQHTHTHTHTNTQVRNMMGAILDVGAGKLTVEDIKHLLQGSLKREDLRCILSPPLPLPPCLPSRSHFESVCAPVCVPACEWMLASFICILWYSPPHHSLLVGSSLFVSS